MTASGPEGNATSAGGEDRTAWGARAVRMLRRVPLPDALVAAALFVLGVFARVQVLPTTQLDKDTVFPYLQALYLLAGWTGTPIPTPADVGAIWPQTYLDWLPFGPALVWSHVPLVVGASSFEEALLRRFVIGATVAPAMYVGIRVAFRAHQKSEMGTDTPWAAMTAAVVGALVVGFTGAPFGPLSLYDETFFSPDMCGFVTAIAVLLFVADRARWLVLALPLLTLAVGVHPYTVCYAPGALLLAMVALARGHWRVVALALALSAAAAVPEIIHLVTGPAVAGGDLASATSNCDIERRTLAALFGRTLQYMVDLQPWPVGYALLAAPLGALVALVIRRRRSRRQPEAWFRRAVSTRSGMGLTVSWALLNLGGFLLAIWMIGCVQPWHWGIVLPSLGLMLSVAVYVPLRLVQNKTNWNVQLALGSKHGVGANIDRGIGLMVVAAALVGAFTLARYQIDNSYVGYGHVAACRWLAETIQLDAEGEDRWVESITLGDEPYESPWIYSPSVFVEQRLSADVEPGRFDASAPLYLIVDGPRLRSLWLAGQMGWSLSLEVSSDVPPQHRWNPPLVSPEAPGVVLVGASAPDPENILLIVRLEDAEASFAWTRTLCDRFPDGGVRTLRRSRDYFSEIRGGSGHWESLPWFAPCCLP